MVFWASGVGNVPDSAKAIRTVSSLIVSRSGPQLPNSALSPSSTRFALRGSPHSFGLADDFAGRKMRPMTTLALGGSCSLHCKRSKFSKFTTMYGHRKETAADTRGWTQIGQRTRGRESGWRLEA